MSNFICPKCNIEIIDSESGYITGCEHFPKDDIAEQSGKHMSDGTSQVKADWMAIQAIQKAALIGKQEGLF